MYYVIHELMRHGVTQKLRKRHTVITKIWVHAE